MNISPRPFTPPAPNSLAGGAPLPAAASAAREKSQLAAGQQLQQLQQPPLNEQAPSELRDAFNTFIGETFYSQMIKSMRSTVDKPAYFHGGRGEEVFQKQLDQVFVERMTEATADHLGGPMFDLFHLRLQQSK